MTIQLKSIASLLKATGKEWIDDKAARLGAALAYYTVFSISPLIIIVIAIAGLWFDDATAQKQIFDQITGLIGTEGAQAIQAILASAKKPEAGITATIVAVLTLLLGATGVFVQLHDALNTIWNVEPKTKGGLWGFVKDRILSFAMVLGIGFLLLVSLILSAASTGLGDYMSGFVPGINFVWQAANFLISFAVIAVLFALIFKVMPDIEIKWHDVWVGALMTALLFNVGKFLLGLYLARSSVASAYGAAGSIVIILLWVFYSAQILFFGAEFTQVYARSCGSHCASAGSSALASQHLSITTTLPTPEQRPVPQARPAPNAFRPRKQDLGVALLFIAACFGSTKLFKHHSKRPG